MVYNPLPWPRSEIVEIDGTSFVAKDIPALGYRTFPPPPPMESKTLSGNTLENEFIKVTLDPVRGVIASLVEKRTGREWVDGSAECGLGQYLNERFESSQTRSTAERINKADGVVIFIQGCPSLVFLLGCATVVLRARTAQCVSSNKVKR